MRKTISVAALLLALTCPAYAGDIPNDSPAPPQPTNASQVPTVNGEMQNDAAESLTQITLDLLAALSPLF
jgi:hypothetical protein